MEVHLVGYIIQFIMMHGQYNIKNFNKHSVSKSRSTELMRLTQKNKTQMKYSN